MNVRVGNEDDILEVPRIFTEVFSAPPWNEPWTKELAFDRLSQLFHIGDSFKLFKDFV